MNHPARSVLPVLRAARLLPAATLLLALAAPQAPAAPVDAAAARRAAEAWSAAHGAARTAAEVETAAGGDGAPAFHLVRFAGGGWAAVAADIGDLRVPQLLSTAWNQEQDVFNHSTPNHYPCGCTASSSPRTARASSSRA